MRRGTLVHLVASMILLGMVMPAQGALERPSYASGDRWVYVLEGNIDRFPGLDPQATGTIALSSASRVEVEIVGSEDVAVGGTTVRVIRVATRSTGFLDGTFAFPEGPIPGPVSVTGSFVANGTELWEDQGYFPIEYRSTSTYKLDVSAIITTRVEIRIRLNVTNSVGQVPAFPLDVGERTSATILSEATVNSTVDAFGERFAMEETTSASWNWSREVLGSETVRVDAGAFPSYRLNQSLSDFAGIAGIGPSGTGNETAYFSNDVGYYVHRTAYVNGSAVATMSLETFSYGAAPPGGLSYPLLLGVAAAVGAAGAGVAFLVLRRRRTSRNADIPREASPKEPDGR